MAGLDLSTLLQELEALVGDELKVTVAPAVRAAPA